MYIAERRIQTHWRRFLICEKCLMSIATTIVQAQWQGFVAQEQYLTVLCKIVGKELFQYPISGSEKYQNEFPTPKYVGIDTLIIIME